MNYFFFFVWLVILFSFVKCEKTTKEITEAFEKDNYNIKTQIEFRGQRGFYATHKTATVLSTKKPKYALYVEGNAYEMGYVKNLHSKSKSS
jgi:hypothetical protein